MIRAQSLVETLANHVRFARYTSAGTQMGLRKPTLINGVYVRSRVAWVQPRLRQLSFVETWKDLSRPGIQS